MRRSPVRPLVWRARALLRATRLRAPDAEQTLYAALNRQVDAGDPVDLDYRFLFIAGAEGSGTTMLTRILSRPPDALCLGGKYSTVDPADETAVLLANYFNKAITRLWDRHAPAPLADRARRSLPYPIGALRRRPTHHNADPIVYKRSSPFNIGDRHRPDLSDITAVWPDGRLILIYRDPRAATVSAFRRGYAPTLRAAAVICEEQLTYLAAQITTLPPERCHILSYDAFCHAPDSFVAPLARFCGYEPAALATAVAAEQVSPQPLTRWQKEIDADARAMLDAHFDERRRQQWAALTTVGEPHE